MKKILLLLSFILIISTKAYSGDGRGELQLSEHAVNEFTRYIQGDATKSGKTLINKPLVFYITNDGSRTFGGIVPIQAAQLLVHRQIKKPVCKQLEKNVQDLQEVDM